jgi:hypothetical protein
LRKRICEALQELEFRGDNLLFRRFQAEEIGAVDLGKLLLLA